MTFGNVRFPILSLRALQRVYGIDATFRSDGGHSLHHPDVEDQIPFVDEGGVNSLTTYRRIPYNQIITTIQTTYLNGRMPIAPVGDPGAGRTDFWKRDNRNLEIIRVHKRMRRRLFLPEGRSLTDIPVPIDELSTKRVTKLEFTDGTILMFSDRWDQDEASRIPSADDLGSDIGE